MLRGKLAGTVGSRFDYLLRQAYDLNAGDAGTTTFANSSADRFDPFTLGKSGVDVRRLHPISLGNKVFQGDLIESSRTNYLKRSLDYSHNEWDAINATVGVAETDVYGEANAFRLTSTATSQPRITDRNVITSGDSLKYCYSVWVKDTGSDYIGIGNYNGGSGKDNILIFQFSDESLTVAGSEVDSHGIAEQIDDWYRIYFVLDNDATLSGSNNFRIVCCDQADIYNTIASSGVEALSCYPQIEQGTFPSTRIDTSGSVVTRAADDLSTTLTTLNSNPNFPAEFTLMALVLPHGYTGNNSDGVTNTYARASGASDDGLQCQLNTNNDFQCSIRNSADGTNYDDSKSGNSFTANKVSSFVVRHNTTDDELEVGINGVMSGSPTTTDGTIKAFTEVDIGGQSGTPDRNCNNYVCLLLWEKVLTDDEIELLHKFLRL